MSKCAKTVLFEQKSHVQPQEEGKVSFPSFSHTTHRPRVTPNAKREVRRQAVHGSSAVAAK
eukprot:scaffold12184_cov114-Isochrysis_galbana.AAC.14